MRLSGQRFEPAPPKPPPVLSVGDLTRQIKGSLERSFTRVLVKGEISGFRGAQPSGHVYFTLKDEEACLSAKIFSSVARRLKFKLREGMEVVAEGAIELYEPRGQYSLTIQKLEPAGEGALAIAFQQLKEKLAADGLIAPNRKRAPRPVPFLPRRIGVVTSKSGAALHDFLKVLHSRNPRAAVLVADARVQGEGSAAEVVRGIKRLSRTDVDVIVVTRGGGSIEDLWTFNEETVARAIHACPVPVISAIGHEVDFTIADFVADLRCPTPSAAAERLSPVLKDLELQLKTAERRLHKAAERKVLACRERLSRLQSKLADPRRVLGQKQLHLGEQTDRLVAALRRQLKLRAERQKALHDRLNRQRPEAKLADRRRQLQKLRARLEAAMREQLKRRAQKLQRGQTGLARVNPIARIHAERKRLATRLARLAQLQRKRLADSHRAFRQAAAALEAMSPLKVLARGYSVTFRREDGALVRSAEDVKVGDAIAVRLAPSGARTLDQCDELDAVVTGTSKGR